MNTGYFLKNKSGKMVPVFVEQGVFSELKNVVSESEVDLNFSGYLMEK